jgi:purine-binding chemotaxis protein CheW
VRAADGDTLSLPAINAPEVINMNSSLSTRTSQYLTCKLGNEVFAVDISKVREVLDSTTVTRVPRMPEFMRGVINLRGAVVPVVDLCLKLGMPTSEQTVNTCVIIVEVAVDQETAVLGAIADSVQEVIELTGEQIEAAPRIGTRLGADFITGMGKHNNRFVIILDMDKVFAVNELVQVRSESAS